MVTAKSTAFINTTFIPYTPMGSIVGDFTNVTSFSSKVVLGYLTSCAAVTIPHLDSCLTSTFAKNRLPSDLLSLFQCGNCSDPSILPDSVIEASVSEAQMSCVAIGENVSGLDTENLSRGYKEVVTSPCWNSLLRMDAYLYIESKWLSTCADSNVPYPISIDEASIFNLDILRHRSTLTCMYDNLFATNPEMFGFPETLPQTQESCFVPGYNNLTLTCKSVIAPGIFKKCSLFDNQQMSMNYEGNSDLILTEFCEFLEKLNTNIGRKCLLELCDYVAMPNPTFPPAASPLPFPPSWVPAFYTALPSEKTFSNTSTLPTVEPSSKPPTFRSTFSFKPSLYPTTIANKTTNPFLEPILNPSTKPAEIPTLPTRSTTHPPSTTLLVPSNSPTQIPTQTIQVPTISSSPVLLPSSVPNTLASNTSQTPSAIAFPSDFKSPIPTIAVAFTTSPSNFPTKKSLQYLVQVDLYITLTMNFTVSHLPSNLQSFLDVLEIAIEEMLAQPISVSVLVRTGNSLSQVDEKPKLDCKLSMNIECHRNDCNQFGHQIADELLTELETNFREGRLQVKIHELAKENAVYVLTNAAIEQLAYEKEIVKLEKTVDEGSERSSSSYRYETLFGFLVVAFSFTFME
jgi:hypothetical protein